jgi:hypothetical protein
VGFEVQFLFRWHSVHDGMYAFSKSQDTFFHACDFESICRSTRFFAQPLPFYLELDYIIFRQGTGIINGLAL